MGIWFSIVIGIITGIASAAIFHLLLRSFKPKIKISNKISRRTVTVNGIESPEYRIKIVNCRRRSIVNVKTYVDIVHEENGVDGIVQKFKKLPSFDSDLPYIDPYKNNDAACPYAVRVKLPSCLMEEWKNPNTARLEVHIFCMDAFSGSGAMFSQTFYGTNAIVDGQFKTGKSLDINVRV